MTERAIVAAAKAQTDLAARAAFLDQTCSGDPALRERVERLLRAEVAREALREVPTISSPNEDDGATQGISPESAVASPAAGEVTLEGSGPDASALAFLSPPQEAGSLGRLDHFEVLEVVGR